MTINVFLIEDSPGDARLTRETLLDCDGSIQVDVATDGVEALAFLRQEAPYLEAPRPDIILLDLNLPRVDGRQVLAQIKENPRLMTIPTIILSTSEAPIDIANCYRLHANTYLNKPGQLESFEAAIRSIHNFWLVMAKLGLAATVPESPA